MGPENQNPLDELQALDEQIGQTTELAGLKPIFFRLDELAKAHPSDFEVQLAVTELKQKVVTRGTALKQMGFTSVRVLDIQTSMHNDWYTFGYPSETSEKK